MSFLENLSQPENWQEPTFEFLADSLFNKLDSVRKDNLGAFKNVTLKKSYIIEEFVKEFRIHFGLDIYPTSRLIFPRKDGRLYFIRDVNLARLVIRIFDIPKKSEDYDVLFNWKRNYHKVKHLQRDKLAFRSLPLIIARIVSNRRLEVPGYGLTVDEVNQKLDDLTKASKQLEQIEILEPIVKKLPIDQLRWIFEIILKNSILGYFEYAIFDLWHPDAFRLFKVCNSLEKTFKYLPDREVRVESNKLVVHPLLPFLPQLSQKLTVSYEKLCQKMSRRYAMNNLLQREYERMDLKDKFVIEEKMDGDRMTLHFKEGHFKFFSRRLKDYTLLYGENFQVGSLTNHLKLAFVSGVKSIILDGEIVAWDYKRNVILPFGILRSSSIQGAVRDFSTSDQYKEQSAYPFFIIFDILHFNGKNLTNMPLFYRKELIKKLINPVPHRLEILEVFYGSNPNDLKDAMKKIITQRCEGIMVKHVLLKYYIANRTWNWIKLKPEYLEQFGENLDLVVIGMEPGVKNSYMVSLRDQNGVYKSFSMVANGFTEYQYDKLERMTNGRWHKFKEFKIPPTIEFGSKKPTYWIHPHESFVLEIKARALDVSEDSAYAVGSSLHNLFCRSIRDDKSVDECITLEEYNKLKKKYIKNVNKNQTPNMNRRLERSTESDPKFLSQRLANLFAGMEFIILSDRLSQNGKRILIQELKTLVKRFGGIIAQRPSNFSTTITLIISEVLIPAAEVYVLKGFNIVKPQWIFESIKRNTALALESTLLLHNNGTISSGTDIYGDSWIIHLNSDALKSTTVLSTSESLHDQIPDDYNNLEIAPPLNFLFHRYNFMLIKIDNNIQYLQDKIERFGGNVVFAYDKYVSFITVPHSLMIDCYRAELLFLVNELSTSIAASVTVTDGQTSKIPSIVTEGFVDACIQHGCLVDVNDYKFV